MSAPAPIHLIPEKISALSSAVAAGGRAVTRAFVDRWSGPPETALAGYLQSAGCTLRIIFTKSSSSAILFIFHVDGPVKVIFDATVSFDINTASDFDPPAPPLSAGDVGVIFVLPSFLIGSPTRQQLDQFAFGAASTSANTLLLALGPARSDMLAVMHPEAGKQAQVRYSPAGVPGPVEPNRGKYSLAWVLAFVRTLGSWMDSDLRENDTPQTLAPVGEQSVEGILFYLLDGFVSGSQALSRPDAAFLQLPDIFQKTYAIYRYRADLKLRLAPDGSLSDADDFKTTQLTLRLQVRDAAAPAAYITAIPNELSVSGRLVASFVAVLQFNVADTFWANLLGVDRLFIHFFFQTAQENAAVFRVARGQSVDTDIVILTGTLQGFVTTIVLSADFIVDMSKDPPAVDLTDTSSIQLLAIARGDGSNATVAFDTVAFLLQYLVNFRHWMGVLR